MVRAYGATAMILAAALPAVAAAQAAPSIAPGASVSGSLAAGDRTEDDDSFFDEYRLTLRERQRVRIDLRSTGFDAFLAVLDAQGERVATDDDGGEGNDARVTLTARAAGVYSIHANSLGAGETGAYTLAVAELPAPPAPTPLTLDRSVAGTLVDGDETDEQGQAFDAYTLTLAASQRVQLAMASEGFDTVVFVLDAQGEILKSDDDGGEDTNSRLVFIAPSAGVYTVRAARYGGEGQGNAYTLTATGLAPVPPPPPPTPLALGRTVSGTLGDADPQDEEERPYDAYTITLAPSQRVALSMRSTEFDTILRLLDAQGEELKSDDDGGELTDSRLTFTAREAGTYTVQATRIGTEGQGAYALSAEALPAAPRAPRPRPLRVGASVRGEIDGRDPLNDNDAAYDAYSLRLALGQTVTIRMSSEELDSVLTVTGPGLEDAGDDDSGVGLNALVTLTAQEEGVYEVRAVSLREGDRGRYTLTVTEGGREVRR